jgi:hypothetical protein
MLSHVDFLRDFLDVQAMDAITYAVLVLHDDPLEFWEDQIASLSRALVGNRTRL